MFIEEINITNFRNWDKVRFLFTPSLNFIIGENGSGKTSILESIYYLSLGSSYRTNYDRELIKKDQNFSLIEARIQSRGRRLVLEVALFPEEQKKIKINGIPKKRIRELIGNIRTTMFSPEDLKITKESPERRRDFIDSILSQINSEFYYQKIRYQKILRHRNMLLKSFSYGRRNEENLRTWDKNLIICGSYLILERIKMIKSLERYVRPYHSEITNQQEELSLYYLSKCVVDEETDISQIENEFEHQLGLERANEEEKGQTLVGPHRDDIGIFISDIDVRKFGSQGQQRTASISLRLGQKDLITDLTGDKPILLLDDVMSELDESRRNALLGCLNEGEQIILTATSPDFLPVESGQEINLIYLDKVESIKDFLM